MAKADVEKWKVSAATAHYNAKEMANLCNESLRQLQRDFRRQLGCTPQPWLNQQRAIVARDLLLSGLLVKTVAYELGFKQPSHFCRHFKCYFRTTPSQFIKKALESHERQSDNIKLDSAT